VLRFRAKKKFAIGLLGDLRPNSVPAMDAHYIATAFDQIYRSLRRDVRHDGLMSETQFSQGQRSTAGRQFHGDIDEYKNAFNIYTETKYTDAPQGTKSRG